MVTVAALPDLQTNCSSELVIFGWSASFNKFEWFIHKADWSGSQIHLNGTKNQNCMDKKYEWFWNYMRASK